MNSTRNAPGAFADVVTSADRRRCPSDPATSAEENFGFAKLTPLGPEGEPSTFRAIDRRSGHSVVLRLHSDPGFRWKRPSPNPGRPCHPGIARFGTAGECSRGAYLVREYIEGVDLGSVMDRQVSLTVREVVDLALQLVEILEVAHRHEEVHGHLVPQNIIVEPSGCVQVTDWGLFGAEAQASRSMREDRQQVVRSLRSLIEAPRKERDADAVLTRQALIEILDRLSSEVFDESALDAALTSLSSLHESLGMRRRVALRRRAALLASL